MSRHVNTKGQITAKRPSVIGTERDTPTGFASSACPTSCRFRFVIAASVDKSGARC